jgi:Ger(x)C family germination protein
MEKERDWLMKKLLTFPLLILLLFGGGCGDVLYIEDTTVMLVLGIDEGKDKKFTIYQISPVFSKEASEKSQLLEVQANSLREAKQYFDVMSNGTVVTGKIQIIIFSKEILKKYEPMNIIDYIYRDAKSSANAQIVMFNGPLDEIMRFETPDKPRFGLFLNNLINSSYKNETTAKTTAATFRKQMSEKGITPYIAELKVVKDGIRVTGIVLLDENGKYVTSIDIYESALLLLLTRQIDEPVPFVVQLPTKEEVVTMNIFNTNYNNNVKTVNGQLQFDLHLNMDVSIEEVSSDNHPIKNKKELIKLIEKQIEKQTEELIKKLQQEEIDPLGLGVYARAYAYNHWKKIENDWPKEFAKSKINVHTKVNVKDHGIIDRTFE